MEIRELQNYTQSQYEDISVLMGQLSQRCLFDQMKLMSVLKDPNNHLYVIEDTSTGSAQVSNRIIGFATLAYSIRQ